MTLVLPLAIMPCCRSHCRALKLPNRATHPKRHRFGKKKPFVAPSPTFIPRPPCHPPQTAMLDTIVPPTISVGIHTRPAIKSSEAFESHCHVPTTSISSSSSLPATDAPSGIWMIDGPHLQKALDTYFPDLAQNELPVVLQGLKTSLESEIGVLFTKRCVARTGTYVESKHIRITHMSTWGALFSPFRATILISTHYIDTNHSTITLISLHGLPHSHSFPHPASCPPPDPNFHLQASHTTPLPLSHDFPPFK